MNSSCWLLMAADGTLVMPSPLVAPSPLEELPSEFFLGPQAARDMITAAARIIEITFFIAFFASAVNFLRRLLLSNFVFSIRRKQHV